MMRQIITHSQHFLQHMPKELPHIRNRSATASYGKGESIMQQKRQIKPEYLTVAELEAITGKSRWSWRRMCYDGRIASVKLGKSLLVPVSELERLMAENTRPSVQEEE
jgi:hypothetical protein